MKRNPNKIPGGADNIPMGKANDGRRRITNEQKLDMHKQYRDGVSINQIARNVGCSKRSVQFELFPERNTASKNHAITAKRWEAYNDKDTRREAMRKYRAKKRLLIAQGKIAIPTSNTPPK